MIYYSYNVLCTAVHNTLYMAYLPVDWRYSVFLISYCDHASA